MSKSQYIGEIYEVKVYRSIGDWVHANSTNLIELFLPSLKIAINCNGDDNSIGLNVLKNVQPLIRYKINNNNNMKISSQIDSKQQQQRQQQQQQQIPIKTLLLDSEFVEKIVEMAKKQEELEILKYNLQNTVESILSFSK